MVMTDKSVKIGENQNHGEHGRFVKGNTIGRMKKKGFTLTDLNKVVMEYEKTHELPILKHYIEQLYKDNNLLSKYIDKNVPTKNINELTGADGEPLKFIIEKTYQGEDDKQQNTSETNP